MIAYIFIVLIVFVTMAYAMVGITPLAQRTKDSLPYLSHADLADMHMNGCDISKLSYRSVEPARTHMPEVLRDFCDCRQCKPTEDEQIEDQKIKLKLAIEDQERRSEERNVRLLTERLQNDQRVREQAQRKWDYDWASMETSMSKLRASDEWRTIMYDDELTYGAPTASAGPAEPESYNIVTWGSSEPVARHSVYPAWSLNAGNGYLFDTKPQSDWSAARSGINQVIVAVRKLSNAGLITLRQREEALTKLYLRLSQLDELIIPREHT